MIHLTDIYGKTWLFRERSIEGLYFDNSHPNNWVILQVGQAKIKTYRWALAVALPHLIEEMPLKL